MSDMHIITKKIISEKSSAKFTINYKKRIRKLREANGTCIPLTMVDDYLFYSCISNWIERMYDYITDHSQLDLLKKYGVRNVKTNVSGVVRDHIYSRKSGFINSVFPEILRHPCNCQLLTHKENIRKLDHYTSYELFKNILTYNGTWKEQALCETLIKKYLDGERTIIHKNIL
jgi:hypothetical protein